METGIPLQPIYKPTNTQQQQRDDSTCQVTLVTPLCRMLDNKYTILSNLFDTLTSSLISLEKSQEIISLVGASTPLLKKQGVKTLYFINTFFEEAIKNVALHTLDIIKQKITCNNLCTIERPELQQPYTYLNTIPFVLKKFIMKKAMQGVNDSYKINLSSYKINLPQNTNYYIESFDISDKQDYAICASKEKNILFLWNLKKGTLLRKFKPQLIKMNRVRFNPTGTEIAFVAYSNGIQGIYTLNIASQTVSKIFQPHTKMVGDIQYLTPSSPHIRGELLSVFTSSNNTHPNAAALWDQNIIQIEKNNAQIIAKQPHCKASTISSRNPEEPLMTKKYEAYLFNNRIVISKHQCPEWYLCRQALNNSTQENALAIIMQSQSYKKLTDYEKQLVTQS